MGDHAYDDVCAALADHETFSSVMPKTPAIPARYADRIPADFFPPTFFDRDPPAHTVMRKAANKVFTRRRVAAMEPRVREIAHELIDAMIDDGSCNLIAQYSYPLATRVSMSMIGVPETDLHRFMELADDHIAVMPYDPSSPHITEEKWLQHWDRLIEAREYFGEQVADRRRRRTEDLVSELVHATDASGARIMTDEQAVSYLLLTVFAGADTTATLIANAVRLFDAHPEQKAEVRRDPKLLANSVEECLRHSPSSMGVNRRTTRDVEVAGTTIPAGSDVFVFTISASSDERRFPRARTFDVHREDAADHVAFGLARHFCMGAPLVRLEVPIALELLWDRLPNLHVTPSAPTRFDPIIVALVYHELSVEWDSAAVPTAV